MYPSICNVKPNTISIGRKGSKGLVGVLDGERVISTNNLIGCVRPFPTRRRKSLTDLVHNLPWKEASKGVNGLETVAINIMGHLLLEVINIKGPNGKLFEVKVKSKPSISLETS